MLLKKQNEDYKGRKKKMGIEDKNNPLENKNIMLLKKQNEDYKNKINKLENRIKELEKIIEEKDKNINKVKIKNDELDKKLKNYLIHIKILMIKWKN